MQLTQKKTLFSKFFDAVLKPRPSFKDFELKDDLHRFRIFEVTDSENVVK